MLENALAVGLGYLGAKSIWFIAWSFIAFRRQKKAVVEQQKQLAVIAEAYKQYEAQQKVQVPDDVGPSIPANAS